MSTDAVNSAVPSISDQGGLLGSVWLNDYNQRLAVQRAAYANACGQTIPPGSGIAFTTNNFPTTPPPTPTQGATQPPANGVGGLLKGAGLAAALLAGGAGGGLGIAALSGAFSQPAAVVKPAVAQPQPGIGINADLEVDPPPK